MAHPKPPAPLAAAVLIGGRSARMGRPKHLLPVDGKSLIERTVALVAEVVPRVVIAGAGTLPDSLEMLPRMADERPDAGPLAGIVSAMQALPGHALLVLSCDLPRMSAAALRWLVAERVIHCLATVPRGSDREYHCLAAIYEPHAITALVEMLDRGMGPIALLQSPDVHPPRVPAELEHCFADTDSPEEWDRFEAGST